MTMNIFTNCGGFSPATKAKVMAHKPTMIGVVGGITFWEHPTRGDECPMLATLEDGTMGMTDFWELPLLVELYTDLEMVAALKGVQS
jgi:hypothetical protein